MSVPESELRWDNILRKMARWQRDQFPAATTRSAIEHIKKEIVELEVNPDDAEEWADLFHLAIQGGVKAAGSLPRFQGFIESKLHVNMFNRTWPQLADKDNVYEHVKTDG